MAELTAPDLRVHASFLEAMEEFRVEGRGGADDHTMLGWEFANFSDTWATPEGFEHFVDTLRAHSREDHPRPAKWVPATTLWYVDGDAFLGRLAIRHRLTEHLLEEGGHIGYDVRPSARRRGHATAMLGDALPIARALGIGRVLVTCDTDNVASRRVIERNGGVLEDERGGKLRFWIG